MYAARSSPRKGPAGGLPRTAEHLRLGAHGRVLDSSDAVRHELLISAAELATVGRGRTGRHDIGALLPITSDTLRVQATRVTAGGQTRIVVAAVRRGHRDEALRELLAQLAFASGLTLIAAPYVGYRTARTALRYRRGAATLADGGQDLRLDVPAYHDDEITRLGHTLNRMLDRLTASTAREHQFIADASHELRTPLTLMRADTVLGVLIDGASAPYQAAARRAGRALTVAYDDTTVHVDPRWLEPAVGTLLDNALRHGAGTIGLGA
ncbi:MAG: HAMP domain-containing protein [Nonomuraea sp.]|nr:HAMP domain-containing protein [Nonomuraea sp.]